MGDYDDGLEAGYWGVDGIPYWMDDNYEEKYDDSEEDNDYDEIVESIEISLTPSKYLQSEEAKYLRAKLINNKLNPSEIDLEIMHDKYNNADKLALEIYCNAKMIGHIQKYDASVDIDKFCFINNKTIESLRLEWNGNAFILSKNVPIKEPEPSHDELVDMIWKGLYTDMYFLEIIATNSSIWVNWEETIKKILSSIEESGTVLYTKEDYRKYIYRNKDLYINKIKEATIKGKQKEEERLYQLTPSAKNAKVKAIIERQELERLELEAERKRKVEEKKLNNKTINSDYEDKRINEIKAALKGQTQHSSSSKNSNSSFASALGLLFLGVLFLGVFYLIFLKLYNDFYPNNSFSYVKNNIYSNIDNTSKKQYISAKSDQECYQKAMHPAKHYSDGSVLCSEDGKAP